jgi:hypothetical protein
MDEQSRVVAGCCLLATSLDLKRARHNERGLGHREARTMSDQADVFEMMGLFLKCHRQKFPTFRTAHHEHNVMAVLLGPGVSRCHKSGYFLSR